MKLSFSNIKFFKRGKQRARNGKSLSEDLHDQQYLAFGGPAEPPRLATSHGHGHRGLKGFGSRGNGNGNGNGHGSDDLSGKMPRRHSSSTYRCRPPVPFHASAALLQLPDAVLACIFAFVCPHAQDRSYEKCEATNFENLCMLCDMRDLAHCAQVCRRWRRAAQQVLYTSIRIDSVHYCEREALLADRRRRRSFFDRNAEPEDTADARLKLLCRTLRDDASGQLGAFIQFLKIPYMLRESRHADIARAVSKLPNLRYVDLPEGLFMDDPVYVTLKLEIQARCSDLRKMTYISGAERSLAGLAAKPCWQNLEVLELVRIGMDPTTLRHVLSSLSNLRALKVTEAAAGPHVFSDEVLASSASEYADEALDESGFRRPPSELLPDIPPLEELVLTDTTRVTAAGLLDYLSRADVRLSLKLLTVHGTGVKPWSLQGILALAQSLRHLTIVEQVSATLPMAAGTKDIRPLASQSLRTLNYEIRAVDGVSPYAGVTRSYYNYLSGSILSGGLPNLRAVYVCDAQFPDSLLLGCSLPPPPGLFGGGAAQVNRPSSAGSLGSSSSPRASVMSGTSGSSSNLGVMQSPMNMLSPPHTPGMRAPQRQSLNPFLDAQSPFKANAVPSSPPASLAPAKPWAKGYNPRFSSNNPFAGLISPQQVKTLEVFTKGDDDLDWSSFVVDSGPDFGMGGGAGNSGRPSSSYGLGAELGAGAGARKSVLVNTGVGNFLAVPDASLPSNPRHSRMDSGGHGPDLWPRPRSSSEKKAEKLDLWR